MQTAHYEITVRGRLTPALEDGFDGLTATASGPHTVLRGEVDQSGLHGVLDRVESLGLELLDIRRSPSVR